MRSGAGSRGGRSCVFGIAIVRAWSERGVDWLKGSHYGDAK
jgi:hypothetical protein